MHNFINKMPFYQVVKRYFTELNISLELEVEEVVEGSFKPQGRAQEAD